MTRPRRSACKDAGLPVAFAAPEEGSVSSACSVCIAAKSANLDLAREAANQFIAAEVQMAIAESLQWAPTNAKVELPPESREATAEADQLVKLDMAGDDPRPSAMDRALQPRDRARLRG